MGYFRGLTDAVFKTGKEGELLFYPWGILGRGRVLPDQQTYERLRRQIARSYIAVFMAFFLCFLVSGNSMSRMIALEFVILVAYGLWFFLGPIREVRRYPLSGEKLRVAESYRNSARSHNPWILAVLFASCLVFAVVGVFLVVAGKILVGTVAVVFSALCSIPIGFMLKQKMAPAGEKL